MDIKINVSMCVDFKHQSENEIHFIELEKSDFILMATNKLKEQYGNNFLNAYDFEVSVTLK